MKLAQAFPSDTWGQNARERAKLERRAREQVKPESPAQATPKTQKPKVPPFVPYRPRDREFTGRKVRLCPTCEAPKFIGEPCCGSLIGGSKS